MHMDSATAIDNAQTATVDTTGVFFDAVAVEATSDKVTPHPGTPAQDFFSDQNIPRGESLAETKKTFEVSGQNDENVVQYRSPKVEAEQATSVFDHEKKAVVPEVLGKSDYSPKVCEAMRSFFYNYPKFRTVTETFYTRNGDVRETEKEVANTPPHFSEFARSIGISRRRMELWRKQHVAFNEAWLDCQEVIKEFYLDNGLMGRYSSTFAIFAAKNETDMKDKSVVENQTVNMNKLLDRIESGQRYTKEEITNT